jgi:hypothetical protein
MMHSRILNQEHKSRRQTAITSHVHKDFWTIVPGKTPRENQCSRFGDFIIQQENIEIFLQRIGLNKILSQTSA